MSDVFFVDFEFRDSSGDVGHHLLVQDAPSFIQKYMMLIYCWSVFAFVYISEKCMFFIDFHVLAVPGSSRDHLDVRFEKSVPAAPISSSAITILCHLYMVKCFFLENRQFLRPEIYLKPPRKPDQFAYACLDKRFIEKIHPCIGEATSVGGRSAAASWTWLFLHTT
jgi:hypothetical protein